MPGKNIIITLDLLSRYQRCCLSGSDDNLEPKEQLRNFSKKEGKISRGKHLRKCSVEKNHRKLGKLKGVQFKETSGIHER